MSQKQPKVPAYFADPIVASNKAMEKEREVYEYEKQHIVLKIDGEDHKLKNSMTLNEFKSTFIPLGSIKPLLKILSYCSFISWSDKETFEIFFPIYSYFGMYCLY